LPENEKYRPWIKHKLDKWEKRRAKERGEEPPPTDAETRKRAKAKD
jgi:hypothetical protein